MEQKMIQQDKQSLYKLVIPLKVELKIKQLLEEIYNTEWSGILFCTYKGSLKNGLTITCKDILPMNIGSTTFTSFEVDEELSSYIIENDLLDCQQHILHSHHSMSTNFSGTDISTLEIEGKDRNNFVSLIVNNEGKYTAAITWKGSYTIKSTTSLFGKQEIIESSSKDNALFYSYMTIERELNTKDSYLTDRIKQLKELKEKEKQKVLIPSVLPYTKPITTEIESVENKKETTQLKLDFKEDNFNFEEEPDIDIPNEVYDETLAKLLSWNLLATNIPDNIKEYTIKSVSEKLETRFKNNQKEYENSLEQLVTGVIETTASLIESNTLNRYDIETCLALVLDDELSIYANKAKYIKDMVKLIKDNWE